MSIFHSSTSGSNNMSLTLHDLVFPVAWFWCECSVHHAQYGQFDIQASISSPTFLAACSWSKLYHLSWMVVVLLFVVFCAVLKWFSSRVVLAIARTRQCASKLSNPDSRSPRNHCIGSRSWCRGKLGLFHIPKGIVFLLWQGLVSLCSWLELDLCTCPNLMDPFHIISSRWVWGICGKL